MLGRRWSEFRSRAEIARWSCGSDSNRAEPHPADLGPRAYTCFLRAPARPRTAWPRNISAHSPSVLFESFSSRLSTATTHQSPVGQDCPAAVGRSRASVGPTFPEGVGLSPLRQTRPHYKVASLSFDRLVTPQPTAHQRQPPHSVTNHTRSRGLLAHGLTEQNAIYPASAPDRAWHRPQPRQWPPRRDCRCHPRQTVGKGTLPA